MEHILHTNLWSSIFQLRWLQSWHNKLFLLPSLTVFFFLCCLCREWSAAVLLQAVRSSTTHPGRELCSGGWSAYPSASSVSVLSSSPCSSAWNCRSEQITQHSSLMERQKWSWYSLGLINGLDNVKKKELKSSLAVNIINYTTVKQQQDAQSNITVCYMAPLESVNDNNINRLNKTHQTYFLPAHINLIAF